MRAWNKQKDRLQIPLMFAFRDAFERRDAIKPGAVEVDGERVVSDRGSIRRRGADETTLKRDLAQDLASLVDTVNLASAVDLADYPYVERSVLNYGLNDLTQVAVGSEEVNKVGTDLKQALADHEPRLGSESLTVRRADEEGDGLKARVRFKVQADMACRPLDVPIEFVAEVDMTAAKVVLPKLPGSS